ncbi:MAG: InlB B-repeat-containing protein [Erysipelotrichaceae bacterium]|jgi:uncharacterized repeat protein (TIGR02543 family)|nr:InlB B-repeat-containing protein [Erysipelotrichaceae bacterium]
MERKGEKKMRNTLRKLLILLWTISYSLLLNLSSLAADTNLSVANFSDLQSAFGNADSVINITVTANITITALLEVPAGKSISITSSGGPWTLTRDSALTGDLITVKATGYLTLSDIIIDGNKANLTANGSLISSSGATILNSGAVLQNNDAGTAAGGAIAVTSTGTLTFNDGEIANNRSNETGGGINLVAGSSINMLGGKIHDNYSDSTNWGGGGIYIAPSAGTLVIGGGEIYGNSAKSYGGGLFTKSPLTLTNVSIHDNTAVEQNGGGIYNDDALTLGAGVLVDNNYAVKTGGGIYNYTSGNLTVDGATISNNTCDIWGGGIYNFGTVTIESGTISSNHADQGNGGGIFNFGDLVINGGTITENSASGGGGIYTNVYLTNNTTVTINGGYITKNTATVGAGLSVYEGDIFINGGTFSGNVASGAGGAIDYNTLNGKKLTISNATFTNNKARVGGGAIGINGSNLSQLEIGANVVFSNNDIDGQAYDIDDDDKALYENQVNPDTTWTDPFTQGYNNVDIEYYGDIQIMLVYFDSDYGSNVDTQMVVRGGLATKPEDPTKYQRFFSGWYTEAALTNKYDFATPVTADMILYAKWVESSMEVDYLVLFHSNGGNEVASQYVLYGNKVTKPNDPTLYGKVFAGWYTEAALTHKYNFNAPVTSDLNLYAKWVDTKNEIEYLVVFESNGGSAVASQQVLRGQTASKPSDPTKSSVYFSGWYSEEGLTNKYDFNTPVNDDIILYAKWVSQEEDIDYLVRFESNGGSAVASQTVLRNHTVTKPNNPTKASKVFAGWYSDSGLTSKYDFNTPVTSDMTLYAKWVDSASDIDYLVVFNSNGGSAVVSQLVKSGQTASKPSDPTKSSMYFSGWYSDSGLTSKYNFNTPVTADITLYAKWVDSEDKIDYLVVFESNGGSAVTPQVVLKGHTVTKPDDPTKSDKYFAGWYSDSGFVTKYDFNDPVNSDMTLYARWANSPDAIEYLVTFDSNGGTSVADQRVLSGDTLIRPADPTKSSMYFSGWYSEAGLVNKYDFNTPVTNDMTLYAKWVDSEDKIDYLVVFESNGGSSVPSQVILKGHTVVKPVDPVKDDKVFAGWYLDSGFNNKYDFNTPVNSDLTLYARWVDSPDEIKYLVVFNSNGGSAVASQLVLSGSLAVKPADPTYSSKYFSGWYSDSGLNSKYDFNTPVTADITLYAKWVNDQNEVDYLVVFESNGGSSVPSQVVLHGNTVTKPTDPSKANYYFSGWYSEAGLVNKYDFTTPVTSDLILYAKWVNNENEIDYLVRFDSNGGSAVPSQVVLHGQTVTKPADPSYVSKYFAGWYSDSGLTSKYDFNTPVISDMTLYAKWVNDETDIEYLIIFNSNGGSSVNSQMVKKGNLVTKPLDPLKPNKYFSGWYSDSSLNTKYDFNTPVEDDMTLYAKWVNSQEEVDYLVSFNSNGGTLVPSQVVKYGEKAIKPANPTKVGSKFTGWYSDAPLTMLYDFTGNVYSDLTLYARWGGDNSLLSYTIYFNKNIPFGTTDGVTAMPSPTSVLANNPFVITAAYVPVGSPTSAAGAYTFKGWATSPTGAVVFKATAYNSDSGILSSAPNKVILGAIYGLNDTIEAVGEDMILYAIWEAPKPPVHPSQPGEIPTGVTGTISLMYPLCFAVCGYVLYRRRKKY